MTNTFHFPDDITKTERARLDEIIGLTKIPDLDLDVVVERKPSLIGDLLGDQFTLFTFRSARPGEFGTKPEPEATKPTEPVSEEREVPLSPGSLGEVFRNLLGWDGESNSQHLDGVILSADETAFVHRVFTSMKITDRQPTAIESNFEISEVLVRDKETGELVGSVVRLGDGTWGYNKDNAS